MTSTNRDDAAAFLRRTWQDLSERERRVIERHVERRHVSRDVNHEFDAQLTVGQRVADSVAAFGGSWTFIIVFGAVLVAWVIANTALLLRPFDPYPYILLNLFLSMIAALQAPVIMMSQNRQAAKDRLDAALDYEVNLKAELEVAGLHVKLDELRDRQWRELVELQRRQLALLDTLIARGAPDRR
jgi:uncharacterized membrane protein